MMTFMTIQTKRTGKLIILGSFHSWKLIFFATVKFYILKSPLTGAYIECKRNKQVLAETQISSLLPDSNIIKAFNGIEAVDMYKENNPDLIFMDIQMPEKDGYTATKEIRALEHKSGKKIPIIALTAATLKGERELCLQAGMDDYLTKPFKEVEIRAMIKKWQNIV